MPSRDFCAVCVADRLRKHGRFDHAKGLLPAVTSVKGTRLCGPHAEEALNGTFPLHEATVYDSPALVTEAENMDARR